ncbi:MAG: hypothetical protein KME05_24385 [Gloeocapsa sp. UFS-A4-WI-NPMV-4B04]|nr:hypothetical protein [Gloeocapsa sp. UFS-A4-WI-NPMV-4B04]
MKLITPYHYKVYERSGTRWFARDAVKTFYNATDRPLDLLNAEQQFGLTVEQVIVALFRINGGKTGFYLANLRDRKYYYCGYSWEDVKMTLHNLGIGRADPVES